MRDQVKKSASDKAYRDSHKGKAREYNTRYRAANREALLEKKRLYNRTKRVRKPLTDEQTRARVNTRLLRAYGVGLSDYERLLIEQDWQCAMCGKTEGERRLSIDHDHKVEGPDSVRGLLCNYCNYRVVGRNNLTRLRQAVAYLEKYEERRVQTKIEDDGHTGPRPVGRGRKTTRPGDEPAG